MRKKEQRVIDTTPILTIPQITDAPPIMQSCNPTAMQKGTNPMFVMNHKEIQATLKAGKKFTYTNPVVDHRPQKADPNQIHITAGGT